MIIVDWVNLVTDKNVNKTVSLGLAYKIKLKEKINIEKWDR